MRIKRLCVKNFKSIKDVDIEFSPLTILVGANATGKSNLINVLRFISHIAKHGIDNAISLQGGISNLANTCLEKGTATEISFTVDFLNEVKFGLNRFDENIVLRVKEIEYSFAFKADLENFGYLIERDTFELKIECFKLDTDLNEEEKHLKLIATRILSLLRENSQSPVVLKNLFQPEGEIDEAFRKKIEDRIEFELGVMYTMCHVEENELMLSSKYFILLRCFNADKFIRLFDFDPKELKKSSSMMSMSFLEENGSNIVSVLRNIVQNKEKEKKLITILKYFLPFIENLTIGSNIDKSYYFIKENYSGHSFHANYLSDGTVNILAIVIALYFENSPGIIILEEPERNIHPKIMHNLILSARDVSKDKQIIITTHNPEFLKHAEIEEVRFLSRDNEGFTLVSSPQNSDTVKLFMQNDLGLDDLFLQNMLGD